MEARGCNIDPPTVELPPELTMESGTVDSLRRLANLRGVKRLPASSWERCLAGTGARMEARG